MLKPIHEDDAQSLIQYDAISHKIDKYLQAARIAMKKQRRMAILRVRSILSKIKFVVVDQGNKKRICEAIKQIDKYLKVDGNIKKRSENQNQMSSQKREYSRFNEEDNKVRVRLYEDNINDFFAGLQECRYEMMQSQCLKCCQYFYENMQIKTRLNYRQYCLILDFKEDIENRFKCILAAANSQGIILITRMPNPSSRTINGQYLTQNNKQQFSQQIKQKLTYMMPKEIVEKIRADYVPLKYNPYEILDQADFQTKFIPGKYVMRIYFDTVDLRDVAYMSYKGGRLRDLSNYKIFRLKDGQIQLIPSKQIYKYFLQKYKNTLKTYSTHYHQPCLKPHIGQPIYQSQQQQQNSQSLNNNKFRYKCLYLIKSQKQQQIKTKIYHILLKYQMRFKITILLNYLDFIIDQQNISTSSQITQINKKVVTLIQHQDKYVELEKAIANHDNKHQIGLQEITRYVYVCEIGQGENFQEEGNMRKIIDAKFKGSQGNGKNGKYYWIYNFKIKTQTKKYNQIVIQFESVNHIQHIYCILLFHFKMRKIHFLDDSTMHKKLKQEQYTKN